MNEHTLITAYNSSGMVPLVEVCLLGWQEYATLCNLYFHKSQ